MHGIALIKGVQDYKCFQMQYFLKLKNILDKTQNNIYLPTHILLYWTPGVTKALFLSTIYSLLVLLLFLSLWMAVSSPSSPLVQNFCVCKNTEIRLCYLIFH